MIGENVSAHALHGAVAGTKITIGLAILIVAVSARKIMRPTAVQPIIGTKGTVNVAVSPNGAPKATSRMIRRVNANATKSVLISTNGMRMSANAFPKAVDGTNGTDADTGKFGIQIIAPVSVQH